MAEILIKATSANWMDDTSKWTAKKVTQEMYDKRSLKGDIFIVRDNKHPWGKCECPPQYVVIKVPNLDWVKMKAIIEQGLYETRVETVNEVERETQVLRKKRIYTVPETLVDEAIKNGGTLEIKDTEMIGYISKRTLDTNKAIVATSITAQEFA
jgi:hypothetical protein